jgi:hypothetical protein
MNQLPVTSSGAGAGATSTNTSAGGSPQGAAAVPNSTQAPPVQNLQAYLTANQPQAVQMGQNIASGLTNQAGQVTGDINADQSAIDAQVQAQNTPVSQTLIDQAAANPTQFVQDPNNVAAFQAQENAAYTGPATSESRPEYQTLTNEVTNAQNNAPDINTSAGVNQLVRGQETNPTLGMSNLDQLLLQGTPEAMAPIAAAEAPFAALPGQLSGAATTEDAAIQAAIANDQAAPAAVNSAFLTGTNAVVPAWETALQDSLTQASGTYANQGSDFNAITADMNANKLASLSPSQLSELGITQAQATDLQNLFNSYSGVYGTGGTPNFSTYYTPGELSGTSPTMANTATANDYAKNAALEQLLGTGYTPYLTDANASQAGQAGTSTNPTFQDSTALNNLSALFGKTDLDTIINSHAGPSDPLTNLNLGPNPAYNASVIQPAAQKMLQYIKQFGASYYPKVDQKWVDAVTRMANNSYT